MQSLRDFRYNPLRTNGQQFCFAKLRLTPCARPAAGRRRRPATSSLRAWRAAILLRKIATGPLYPTGYMRFRAIKFHIVSVNAFIPKSPGPDFFNS
jgi:hypothetical protein